MDELVERAKRGDREAIEKLLESIAPAVRRFSLRMCKNQHDADDVLQDTLLNVAEHIGDFEGRSSLPSWVFALTRSACARRRRGLKNRPPKEPDEQRPDGGVTPDVDAERRELSEILMRALESLPEQQREVLLLRDMEGLSAQEAAAALEISIDALKSRLHRARASLKERLDVVLSPEPEPRSGCPDIVQAWSRRLDGELSQPDCARMEAHVSSCPHCQKACDALKFALRLCQQASNEPVPASIQERIRAAMRALT